MKKRIAKITVALFAVFGLAGCVKTSQTADPSTVEQTSEATSEITASETESSIEESVSETMETTPVEELDLLTQLERLHGENFSYDKPIFESASRLYTEEELGQLPDALLPVFRNEIYARHGRIFQTDEWVGLFTKFSWYQQIYSAEQFQKDQLFNDFEQKNLKLVLQEEANRGQSGVFSPADYPRIDGSTATIPLSEQFAADAMDIPIEEARLYILHNQTHNAYVNLIEGKADLILVTEPSAAELQLAQQAGVELEVHPVVKEAFVFLTNENNPVKNLTQQQIKGIYSGAISSWKELGGPDHEIAAYQRPVNSGSQTGMLSLVMGDTPMVKPQTEEFYFGMDDLVEAVCEYDNGQDAIGYSYYYYVSSMYIRKGIQLMAVDGIEPKEATIKDGSYPYTTAYYAVFRKNEPAGSKVRQLYDWMIGAGQQSAVQAGYIPLN